MFTIYVNDLATHLSNCLLIQYADDTQFIISGSIENLDELLRRTEGMLKKIKCYFNKNGLLLNTNKTKCMFIGSRALLSKIPKDTVIQADDTRILPL